MNVVYANIGQITLAFVCYFTKTERNVPLNCHCCSVCSFYCCLLLWVSLLPGPPPSFSSLDFFCMFVISRKLKEMSL